MHSSPEGVSSKDESSSGKEMTPFSASKEAMLAAGEPAALSPSAFVSKYGQHCPCLMRVLMPLGPEIALAVAIATLGAVVYISARMLTSLLLRHSKQFPRVAIMASANLAATPSLIVIATLHQCQPLGGGCSGHSAGSDKLIRFSGGGGAMELCRYGKKGSKLKNINGLASPNVQPNRRGQYFINYNGFHDTISTHKSCETICSMIPM